MFNFGGGMLTGAEIERQIRKGNIQISPYDPGCLNPNSYNLKLHPQLLIYKRDSDRLNILPQNNNSAIATLEKCKYTDTEAKCVYADECNFDNTEELSEGGRRVIESYNNEAFEKEATEIGIAVNNNSISFINSIEKTISYTEEKIRQDMNILYENINTDIYNLNKLSNIDSVKLDPIDMMKPNETIEFEIPEEGYVLQPGVLYIGRTVENTFTDKFIPMINGRSSVGRLGISIHITAGFGDVGFDGTWTLEITCVEPVRIYPNVPIAQVCYFKPCGKVRDLYMGRYLGQKDATASRFYK